MLLRQRAAEGKRGLEVNDEASGAQTSQRFSSITRKTVVLAARQKSPEVTRSLWP